MLCASCGLACFADGGNLNDIEQMWIKNECERTHTRLSSLLLAVLLTRSSLCSVVDMGLSANSVYLSLWGILGSAGGLVVPYLLPLLVRPALPHPRVLRVVW